MVGGDIEHTLVHGGEIGHCGRVVEQREHRELGQIMTVAVHDLGLLAAFGQIEDAASLWWKACHRHPPW